jgi:hypothetical protein
MIAQFFQTEAGLALYGVLILAFVDFGLGVAAAFRDDTFSLDALAAFLRKHIAGRVFPIALLLMAGHFGSQPALLALGLAGAAAYVLETIGSIRDSWGKTNRVQPVPED